jgi:phosphotriesterase-related protein
MSLSPQAPAPYGRRNFIRVAATALLGQALGSTVNLPSPSPAGINTVQGWLPAADLGITLTHEHVLVDFAGSDQEATLRYSLDEAVDAARPHLARLRNQGVSTFFDATPAHLGRNVRLLRRLSQETGLHLVSNTGLFGAFDGKHLPAYAHRESAREIAARWTAEAREGIDGTDIRAGFIKCAVEPRGGLSAMNRKLIEAAALTHAATGLAITVHTGAGPGLAQIDILRRHGISASAFVWIHALWAPDDTLSAAADRGAWLSFDRLDPTLIGRHLFLCEMMRQRGQLGQVLLSHDEGWFDPAKPVGERFARSYDLLLGRFVPLLRSKGFSEPEVQLLLRKNPAKAFSSDRTV